MRSYKLFQVLLTYDLTILMFIHLPSLEQRFGVLRSVSSSCNLFDMVAQSI